MERRWTQQLLVDQISASENDRDESFCPECGQSLDLARHRKATGKRRTLEPLIFLIFGLCLTVAFGLRGRNVHSGLAHVDQQIAALRARAERGFLPEPGNPSMIVADTMSELLTEQAALRTGFQRYLIGLGLGLLTLVVGAVSWLHEQPEPVSRWRNQRNRLRRSEVLPSGRAHDGGTAWKTGSLITTSLVRVVLLLFVTNIGTQLIRGTPPSFQLMDQTLTRVIAIVVTIAAGVQ